MTREKVLLVGDSNTSKSWSLLQLALLYPDNQVVILDPDDGTSKVADEIGITLESIPNLTIIPVYADFEQLIESYNLVKTNILEPGDWLCFDMLGRFWDLAQQYYSVRVFGEKPIEHMLTLRKIMGGVSFGGFDGLKDWSLIKRLHNELLLDDAVVYSEFNVMATTSVGGFLPVEKKPKKGIQSVYASVFGVKVEGEKHNTYRFDTQAMLYRTEDDEYMFRLVRDRGRDVDMEQEYSITGSSFWEVYAEMRGIKLGV